MTTRGPEGGLMGLPHGVARLPTVVPSLAGGAGLRVKKPPHAAHRPACWPTQIDHDHAHDHDASTVHVVILSCDRGPGLRVKKPPPYRHPEF
jgi:hypothetical protein